MSKLRMTRLEEKSHRNHDSVSGSLSKGKQHPNIQITQQSMLSLVLNAHMLVSYGVVENLKGK